MAHEPAELRPPHCAIVSRVSLIEHLDRDHMWQWGIDEASPAYSGDPLGWHRDGGGYVVTTAELFAAHRELHLLAGLTHGDGEGKVGIG